MLCPANAPAHAEPTKSRKTPQGSSLLFLTVCKVTPLLSLRYSSSFHLSPPICQSGAEARTAEEGEGVEIRAVPAEVEAICVCVRGGGAVGRKGGH